MRFFKYSVLILLSWGLCSSCKEVPPLDVEYSPLKYQFSGDSALALEAEFVKLFPLRSSGTPNNRKAVRWLQEIFSNLGMITKIDEWTVMNYSKPLFLNNVIATLPGNSTEEIIIVAHHDQSPDTYEGADNDGSGIAILLHLAQIFSRIEERKYTMVFLSSDGEEYGMLGSLHYVETHPDIERIIAAISLDNLGKKIYNGLMMDARGQFRNYGDLWLQLLTQKVALNAENLWVPQISSPLEQVLFQAVPVSFMDEGPFVAKRIPSFGLTGIVPFQEIDTHWNTYHTLHDTIGLQSSITLQHAGQVVEGLAKKLLTMDDFPKEKGPYIYFPNKQLVLREIPLWSIFILFIVLFMAVSLLAFQKINRNKKAWRQALQHFLSLWIPLIASILLLYLFVEIGLMDKYYLYPATAKDEPLFEPKWGAVLLWLFSLFVLFFISRKYLRSILPKNLSITFMARKCIAFLMTGLAMIYILLVNPFSLLFLLPTPVWLLIRGRSGQLNKIKDVLLFLIGGVIVYLLCYFFGFVVLRNGLAVIWYLMMMFSIKMISFPTSLAITAVIAAGLSMVVNQPVATYKSN